MSDLLQTSSELLRLILFILDESVNILETYQDFQGKKDLESACLYALNLLDTGLSLQSTFLAAAKASDSPLLLTPLDRLLQVSGAQNLIFAKDF